MSNDVLLVPITVEQPNVEAQSDVVIYVPQAHKNKAGIVKEGDGINIENGVVSLDTQTVEDMIDANKWVSYGFQQNLTEDEKGMARHNIGAGDNDFTGSYYDVTQKPHLNTDNFVSLPIGDEEINNTVQLHKISKTGSFNDLNDVPYETLDFAESERQKSKNLFNINGYVIDSPNYQNKYVVNGNALTTTNDYVQQFPSGLCFKTTVNTTYTISFNLTYTNYCRVYIYGILNGTYTEPDIRQIENHGFVSFIFNSSNYEHMAIGFSSALGESATFQNVQIEEGLVATDYQPYHGQITHNGDAPVVFAEAERQKSKNLFSYPYKGGSSLYGVNIADNGDGSFTINGQQSSTTYNSIHFLYSFNNWTDKISPFKLSAGTYTIGVFGVGETEGFSLVVNSDDGAYYIAGIGSPRTFTINKDTYFEIYIQVSKHSVFNFDNFVVSPMLVSGTELGDYQPYNGAIVHEKDIADVEHIETIYDMLSSDESINLGYTGGIQPEGTISNLDLSKYKTLKIWFANYGLLQYQGFLTLSIVGNGSRECQTTSWNSNYQVAVNKLDNVSSITNLSGDDNRIWKIEGVY